MPELPEVETTRAGIAPYILNQTIESVIVRQPKLRWPVPAELSTKLVGLEVLSVERRGKYLLINIETGTVIVHLGMSGSLRVLETASLPAKHDHVDILFSGSVVLRYNDPRRFGCVLWVEGNPFEHSLLASLGPEPLTEEFNGKYLFQRSRRRVVPVKSFIMDSKVVVGAGNIYANEALFMAGIHPFRASGKISRQRYDRLAKAIKQVLAAAIIQGGTTLREFVGSDGRPGYFSQQLQVYGRGQQPCSRCGRSLKEDRLNQRATVFCSGCQR